MAKAPLLVDAYSLLTSVQQQQLLQLSKLLVLVVLLLLPLPPIVLYSSNKTGAVVPS